jgi:hypothetical protein
MAGKNRATKFLSGVAAAVALSFVAAPAATAAPPDDTKNTSSKVKPLRDTGWGR